MLIQLFLVPLKSYQIGLFKWAIDKHLHLRCLVTITNQKGDVARFSRSMAAGLAGARQGQLASEEKYHLGTSHDYPNKNSGALNMSATFFNGQGRLTFRCCAPSSESNRTMGLEEGIYRPSP